MKKTTAPTPKSKPAKPFERYLRDTGRSPLTVQSYLGTLREFDTWFAQTNGEALAPHRLTPTDAREYRAWLLRRKAAAATVNRKLIALRA